MIGLIGCGFCDSYLWDYLVVIYFFLKIWSKCIAVVAEWLRRWTRNPLGSARTGSNPVGSEMFYNWSIFIIRPLETMDLIMDIACIIPAAVVAEWLRRWTWNPLGYARTGSNPVDSDMILIFQWPNWSNIEGYATSASAFSCGHDDQINKSCRIVETGKE